MQRATPLSTNSARIRRPVFVTLLSGSDTVSTHVESAENRAYELDQTTEANERRGAMV